MASIPNPRDRESHSVYTKPTWSDVWEFKFNLYCDQFKHVASPDITQAILTYQYGDVLGHDESVFSERDKLDLIGQFVMVEIDVSEELETPRWFGVIVEADNDLWGFDKQAGRQQFVALDLTILLERQTIQTSYVETGDDNISKEINRGIGFNLGGGQSVNREATPNGGGTGDTVPLFKKTLKDAVLWNSYEMLIYLLKFHSPVDEAGSERIDIELRGQLDFLTARRPTLRTHGRTLKDLIDELVSRTRLQGWTLEVDYKGNTAPDEVFLKVFNFNAEDITMPNGDVLDANDAQSSTETSLRSDLATIIRTSGLHTYSRVVCRSERRGTVMTIGAGDSLLERDWDTTTLQGEYQVGASGSTAYANATTALEKMDLNEAYRKDERFERVWRFFRVPTDWDGLIASEPTNPTLKADGTPDTEQTPFWQVGLRFQRYLPLLTDNDYSSLPPTDAPPGDSKSQVRRPFAVIKEGSRYYYLHNLNPGFTNGTEREWSASLRMQDDQLGIICHVGGSHQHALGLSDFTPVDAVDTADSGANIKALNWADIAATVYLQWDEQVRSAWPEGDDSLFEFSRTLYIDVAGYRLDYLMRNTVLGINDEGQTVKAGDAGFIRDDRAELLNLARLAYEWYSRERKAITFRIENLGTIWRVGEMVSTINEGHPGEVEVNAVVTEVSYDLVNGVQTVKTDYGELDVRAL